MSDGYIYQDLGYFYPNKTTENKKKIAKNKLLKLLVLIFALLLIIECFVLFLVIPSVQNLNVVFVDTPLYLQETIKKQISPLSLQNWFEFDSNYAKSLIYDNSFVENVVIKKSIPNKVLISVEEREPIAFTLVNSQGKSKAFYIDKNGVLFQNKVYDQQSKLPLITAFTINNPQDGYRLNSSDRNVLEQVLKIQKTKPEYLSVISEISIAKKENGNFDLLLYPMYSKVKIITDRILNEESLQYMMIALDLVRTLSQPVSEIDLRYGSVSYKN